MWSMYRAVGHVPGLLLAGGGCRQVWMTNQEASCAWSTGDTFRGETRPTTVTLSPGTWGVYFAIKWWKDYQTEKMINRKYLYRNIPNLPVYSNKIFFTLKGPFYSAFSEKYSPLWQWGACWQPTDETQASLGPPRHTRIVTDIVTVFLGGQESNWLLD